MKGDFMSAVYVLYVCKNVTHFKDPDSYTNYGERPQHEIFGIYSSKKRAKKNIEEALADRLYKEKCYMHELGRQLVSSKIEENSPKSRYKGFKIELITIGRDPDTYEKKIFKDRISWHCYIRRYVVD